MTGRPMRITGLLLPIVLAICTGTYALQKKSAASNGKGAGSPKVVLDDPRYDFGEVFAGEQFFHVFLVRNAGTVPLELSEGKPTSPTAPPDPHQKVKPGEPTPETGTNDHSSSAQVISADLYNPWLTTSRSWRAKNVGLRLAPGSGISRAAPS